MATLTPEQITQYYATEGNKANPLSPTDWLASQSAPAPTTTTAPAPTTTTAPTASTAIPMSGGYVAQPAPTTTTAPTSGTSSGYVMIQTSNGPAYFQQSSSGLVAVSPNDPNLAGLKSGTIQATEQPAITGGADRFYNPDLATPSAGTGGELVKNVTDAVSNTVPSNVLGSTNTTSGILSQAQGLYTSYQDYQKQLMSAATPSDEEVALEKQLADLNTKLQQGLVGISGQAIPTPLIGLQSQKLKENFANVIMPLQNQLDALIKARSTKVDAITRVMEGTPTMFNMLMNMQKLTMPDVLGTKVNDQTGDVYAITQGADGQVTTSVIGNIGSNNTGKAYVQTGTYQAGDGKQYFYGVNPDGTITNVQLQGAGSTSSTSGGTTTGTGGTYKFTQNQLQTGASSASMTLDQFKQLPGEIQNLYVHNATVLKTLTQDIQAANSGSGDVQEVIDGINSSNLSDSAKQYFLSQIKTTPSGSANTSETPFDATALGIAYNTVTGIPSTIGNWFTSALNYFGY